MSKNRKGVQMKKRLCTCAFVTFVCAVALPFGASAYASDPSAETNATASAAIAAVPVAASDASVAETPAATNAASTPATTVESTTATGSTQIASTTGTVSASDATTTDAAASATTTKSTTGTGSTQATSSSTVTAPATSAATAASASTATTVKSAAVAAPAQSTVQAASSTMITIQATSSVIATNQILDENSVYTVQLSADSSKVLDVSGGSYADGANVQVYESNTTLAQYFRAAWLGDGWYNFINLRSGKYLDVAAARTASGTNVQQYTGNGTNAQKWGLVVVGGGLYQIVPFIDQGKRLDVAGGSTGNRANIQIYASNGTKAQQFSIVRQDALSDAYALSRKSGFALLDGDVSYEVVSALDSNKVLDVPGASQASGANVQLYTANNTNAQKFQFRYVGSGLYTIVNVNSGKVLDVAGGSTANGANVQQYASNGTLAQMWYLVSSDSYYTIFSAKSGKVLDIVGAHTANGTNVQQYASNGTNAQKFVLRATQLIQDGTYVIETSLIAPMVLDVAGASKASGANVQIYRSNGTSAQQFTFVYNASTKTYSILNANSGLYVTVKGGGTANGTNVIQQTYDGSKAQQWYVSMSNGVYSFKSACNGLYLDVAGASDLGGTNVQVYTGNGSAAQRFSLKTGSWSFYSGASSDAMALITEAEKYQGWAYVWGGRSPATGFDCAGLVEYCANTVFGMGIDTLYTNAERLLNDYCVVVSKVNAVAGDLCFFRGTYGSDVDYISHVLIYCGSGVGYGAGDPISYTDVSSITNIYDQTASVVYARLRR